MAKQFYVILFLFINASGNTLFSIDSYFIDNNVIKTLLHNTNNKNNNQYLSDSLETSKPPVDGREFFYCGIAFTSLGVLGITSGLLVLSSSNSNYNSSGMGYSIALGDMGLSKIFLTCGIISGTTGIAMFIIGKKKREEYLLWKSQQYSFKLFYRLDNIVLYF